MCSLASLKVKTTNRKDNKNIWKHIGHLRVLNLIKPVWTIKKRSFFNQDGQNLG